MEHHFNVEFAEKYGMLEAVLINHLQFWIKKNEANEVNCYDGHYWTYNSTRAFHNLFPYVSERRIRNALKRLEDEDIIITGNYNKSAYDRTMWYAITEKGYSILQFCKMEDAKMLNQSDKKVKPIPDNKTNNNKDIIEVVDYLNQKAGTHYRYSTKETQRLIRARLKEFSMEEIKEVIDKKTKQWKGTKMEEFLRPQTLFGNKFESYLNSNITKEQKPKRYKEFQTQKEVEAVQMPDEIRDRLRGMF